MANIWQKLEIPALIIVPMSLLSAAFMQVDQSALLTMVVVLLSVLVFFASFEASRPQLRQIMPTVVREPVAMAVMISSASIVRIRLFSVFRFIPLLPFSNE